MGRTPDPGAIPRSPRDLSREDPEKIPREKQADPDGVRDQVGISSCKSFRFRDQKKFLCFE